MLFRDNELTHEKATFLFEIIQKVVCLCFNHNIQWLFHAIPQTRVSVLVKTKQRGYLSGYDLKVYCLKNVEEFFILLLLFLGGVVFGPGLY